MKEGDKVQLKNARTGAVQSVIYTILEVTDTFVRVKHPEIGGYFTVKPEMIVLK